jgi:ABC-2 type transport system ATP-binding protein
MDGIDPGFEITKSEELENEFYNTTIRILNGKSPNELLKSLIDNVEVHSFIEKIPTMNEIFITTVQGGGEHE